MPTAQPEFTKDAEDTKLLAGVVSERHCPSEDTRAPVSAGILCGVAWDWIDRSRRVCGGASRCVVGAFVYGPQKKGMRRGRERRPQVTLGCHTSHFFSAVWGCSHR